MAKKTTQFVCSACDHRTPKWLGKCPHCGAFGTLEEEQLPRGVGAIITEGNSLQPQAFTPNNASGERLQTHSEELNQVFGGGMQPASLTLLSGEPGIGKSTLVLALAAHLAKSHKVLYISGEESLQQVSGRAQRLGVTSEDELQFIQTNNLEDIIATMDAYGPEVIIVDSIQVISSKEHSSFAGSITQVRLCTEHLLEYTKTRGITGLIIGHVTKDGNLAGPRVLEHLVDTVLMLEGDRGSHLRILRALKNRFGAADEIGVFAMEGQGLVDVSNPSAQFLEGRNDGAFGTAIASVREGNRAFLVEVQALTSYTKFGYPKRTSSGFDTNRLHLLLAVLGKYTKVQLDSYDVYVNMAGGMRSKEPTIDLAVIMAIASSKLQKAIPHGFVILGEVGLTGEVRTIPFLERRVKEAEKLGFTDIIVPAQKDLPKVKGATLHSAKTVKEAIAHIFG